LAGTMAREERGYLTKKGGGTVREEGRQQKKLNLDARDSSLRGMSGGGRTEKA